MSEPFIAEIRIFAGNFAPRGWAFCNGQLLPIAQNTALFSLIGTTYGGDGGPRSGSPTSGSGPDSPRAWARPDEPDARRDRRIDHRDTDDRPAPVPHASRERLGRRDHEEGETTVAGNLTGETDASDPLYTTATGAPVEMDLGLQSQGGGGSHENEQPYLTLSYIIALQGVFPSRS